MRKFFSERIKQVCAVITASSFILSIMSNIGYTAVGASSVVMQSNIFEIKGIQQQGRLLNERYGKVTEIKDNRSETVVINIQDLHCDYSVQKNISRIIEEIAKKYKVKVEGVYVEGGVGEIDTSIFSKIIQNS